MAKREIGMEKREEMGEKISGAILKVALGYQVAEVTEEYVEMDGELKLTKRKKTKKDVPPDLKAAQLLLEMDGGGVGYADWTDEELEKERLRLMEALRETERLSSDEASEETSAKKTKVAKVVKKTVKKRAVSRRKKDQGVN